MKHWEQQANDYANKLNLTYLEKLMVIASYIEGCKAQGLYDEYDRGYRDGYKMGLKSAKAHITEGVRSFINNYLPDKE
jgi:hypothetical protein